jgi:purine-cytosine permease-like protein
LEQNLKFGPTSQPSLRIFRFGTQESKDIFILEIILILHTNIIGTLIHILRYPIILMGSILIERFYCNNKNKPDFGPWNGLKESRGRGGFVGVAGIIVWRHQVFLMSNFCMVDY